MKKFFFTAALSFVAVLCISATVVESNHTEPHPSAVIASIDGIDDEITQKIQGFSRQSGERKVDPDTALNDNNQQYGQARRLERKKQHQNNKERGEDGNHQIVRNERCRQVSGTGGITHHIIVICVVFSDDGTHFVQEGVGFLPLFRKRQINDHAAVPVILQLRLGLFQ